MKTLSPQTFVTVAGWNRAFKFNTARGYAAQYGEDQEAAHARCVGFGHDTAWTVNPGSALLGDRAAAAALLQQEARDLAGSTVLQNGEQVEIEGKSFTVRVMGAKFSDPIHFLAA